MIRGGVSLRTPPDIGEITLSKLNAPADFNGNWDLPEAINDETELEEILSRPTAEVIQAVSELEGDLMILGIGGKMGPSLARLAKRSAEAAGKKLRVIGVSRFSNKALQDELEKDGVETIPCDLLNSESLNKLPDIRNIVFMAGKKFGSTGAESGTWAMNTFLPGMTAQKFKDSKIVAFSTGNVYPLTKVIYGGADENVTPSPIGEYAQSCLGRERILEHFSRQNETPALIFRLCYAIDLRYGVILDIAQKIFAKQPVDVTMGHAAVIWQGDANAQVLRSFKYCDTPPVRLNITGPETISIRWLAAKLGQYLEMEPNIVGEESNTALLVNASKAASLFGYPKVPLEYMLKWIAHWVKIGGTTLNKPTHFETRDGRF